MKANETAMMFEVDEAKRLEDKRVFVDNLGKLLKQTRENIKQVSLADDETVSIIYNNGHCRHVNIAADSYMAIIRDVVRMV